MPKQAIFDKKNILVTGGAGFIGSHLCDELVKTCKVICLDNFITGDERNIDHLLADPNFVFLRHDITESINLESLPELQKFKIEFQGIQEIYHLACPTSPKDFEKNKIATIDALSIGMKNILDLAVKYEAKLMHFSSTVVYGPRRADNKKIAEEDIGQVDMLSARGCYDEGKRFAETMAANYREARKIDAKIIRLFRIYGPRMKLDQGNMIPDFISNALDNKDLAVLGNKNFSSSFCYVSDCLDAAVKMMDSDLAGPINIGSDINVNVTEVAEKMISMLNSKSKITYADKILFMTPLCLPDIAKAHNELGWMPIVTLENGLEKTIEDLRASKGLKGIGK
ncbi:MAG: GDP-mannose 4,6-dehydratase [Patescibacteria group bacterium]|nr:GDP-mannose 4,6-dehydratase [Patescibacteria group bacterium]